MLERFYRLSLAVASLYRDIQKIERTEMEKFGLKGPYVQCLLALGGYEKGLTATELCEICEKDKAAISRTVAELEKEGMVERPACNGVHYRSPICLTQQGREAARTVQNKTIQAIRLAGEGLEDDRRQIFYEVLELISRNLHNICKNGLDQEEV